MAEVNAVPYHHHPVNGRPEVIPSTALPPSQLEPAPRHPQHALGYLTASALAALLLLGLAGRARLAPGRTLWLSLFLVSAARASLATRAPIRLDPTRALEQVSLTDFLERDRAAWLCGPWREDRRRSDGRSGAIGTCPTPLRIAAQDFERPASWQAQSLAMLSLGSPWLEARGESSPQQPPRVNGFGVDVDELYRSRASAPEVSLAAWLRRWRRRLVARCDGLESTEARALTAALLLGDRSRLPSELSDLFTRTGTRHLLSLSGLHVALIAAMIARPLGTGLALLLGGLLRPLLPGVPSARALRRIASASTAALVCALVPIGGASPPIARAALAIALAWLAPSLAGRSAHLRDAGRGVDARNLWGLALALECALDPLAPTKVGVQLSYCATIALLTGMRGMRAWTTALELPPRDPRPVDRLGRARDPRWRLPLACATRLFREGLAASALATLATLAIAWTTFGEFAPIGVLATPLVLPLLALLILCGWAWLLFPWVVGAAWPSWSSHALIALLELADHLPGTPLSLPPRPAPVLIAACAALTLGVARGPRGGMRWARIGAGLLGLCWLPWARPARGLELVVCDVGNGTAVAMRAPGLPALIFDAGSRDRGSLGRDALAPVLRRWEVERPIVVLSHEHRDHASALPWLIERWPPALWVGALPEELRARLPSDLQRLDLEVGALRLPLPLGARDAPRIELLRGGPEAGNEGSRSLLVHFGERSLLLSGDAEGTGLLRLLASGEVHGPLELLLAPHHGSESPLSAPLLELCRPRRVWASTSGQPAFASAARATGLELLTTARQGPLWLRLSAADSSPSIRRQGSRGPVLPARAPPEH